jgi:hypothetical protein
VTIFVFVRDANQNQTHDVNYTVTAGKFIHLFCCLELETPKLTVVCVDSGNSDDCLIFASNDRPQDTSETNPPNNQVWVQNLFPSPSRPLIINLDDRTPQRLPQCSDIQVNWTDGSLAQ